MLNKRRFQEQVSLLSTHFMREIDRDLLEEYWKRLKGIDQEIWDRAVDDILMKERKFPVISVFKYYVDMNTPTEEAKDWPDMGDLRKCAKEGRHKWYIKLIEDLIDGKTDKNDIRYRKVLKEVKGLGRG